jgi:hypothetical protein
MTAVVRAHDEQLQAYVRDESRRQGEILSQFQEEGSLLTMEHMRFFVPIKRGFLRESIDREFTQRGFVVFPRASYAEAVDKGTAPHMIFARKGRFLRFETVSGGVIFARHVHHPGFPGRFFVRRTAEAVRERLKLLLDAITERVYS